MCELHHAADANEVLLAPVWRVCRRHSAEEVQPVLIRASVGIELHISDDRTLAAAAVRRRAKLQAANPQLRRDQAGRIEIAEHRAAATERIGRDAAEERYGLTDEGVLLSGT